MSLLQVTDLSVSYDGRRVLDAVRLSVAPGEVVGIAGTSGSGKTTLALAIAGLLPAEAVVSGSIAFRHRELCGLRERDLQPIRGAAIGFVFQESALALNPLLTAGAQIVEVVRAHERCRRTEAIDRARKALDEVGFGVERGRVFNAYPHELSGGERQRILIAQAIVCRPALVIADEPVSSLDEESQSEVLELMGALKARLGIAFLVIAHNREVLSAIADRVERLDAGRLAAAAPHAGLGVTQPLLRADVGAVARERDPIASDSRDAQPIAQLVGVCRTYRRRALFRTANPVVLLTNVDLSIERGSSVGLIGPSGCGKSTLARCLAGLERVDGGKVRIAGQDITALPDRALLPYRNQVQLVFQDAAAALNPRFTVLEIVSEPMVIQGVGTTRERRDRTADLLSRVGLPPDRLEARAGEFSGGERQRLAIARALAVTPRLLIFDEAFTGLDPTTRDRILALLADLQASLGLTYLYISHDRDLLALVATDVAVMRNGRIVDRGRAARVLRPPHGRRTGPSSGSSAEPLVASETVA